MRKKLLVFLRAYNDIDHIAPVIYKWLSVENVPVDVVMTGNRTLLDDYRLNFLQEFEHFRLHHIYDFLPDKGKRCEHISQVQQMPRFNPLHFSYRLIGKYLNPNLWKPRTCAPKLIETVLDSLLENVEQSCVVFDWTYTDFARLGTKAARDRGSITISLPHGDCPYVNRMEELNNLNYSCMDAYADAVIFDYTVVPNKLCAARYEPHLESDQLKILGSPRYNDEWLSVMSRLVPEYQSAKGRGKVKVVFFLRSLNHPIFWEEVIRTIKLVTQFPNVHMVVKHHTRSATIGRLTHMYRELTMPTVPNLEFAFEDEHSAGLIKWADVIIDVGTSAVFEAVKYGIPILSVEYLHPSFSTVAYYMKRCEMKCRDNLYDAIQMFVQKRDTQWYHEEERKRFIQEMIDFPDASVLERYVQFLRDCMNKSMHVK